MKKYWHIFTIQLINSLAYPAELVGRSLLMLPFMWIFAQLWKVTYQAAGSEQISGMTLSATLWYLMLAETIELSRSNVSGQISQAVKEGSIAYLLNKPYDFLLYQYCTSMGESIFRAMMNAVLGSLVVWALVGPPPSLPGFLVVIPVILGAWTVTFCMAAMIGLLSFQLEDISGFQWIYQKLTFILGGLLIPLDFYPAWLQTIAKALPFAATMYAPARLFVDPDPQAFLATLGLQLFWLTILGTLLWFFYQRSLRHLSVNGG